MKRAPVSRVSARDRRAFRLEAILNGAISLEDRHDDVESELAAGVLTIKFESSNRAWVINKQTPNRQIWFSSPIRYGTPSSRAE
mmetsp:Transcript_11636/g.38284  ORF Transcript_11636/g.38284 Transcript_11636/m.38284 type:complete len:84 (+) Transcript_11636:145-396(+)